MADSPGIHPSVQAMDWDEDEWSIAQRFAREWYVTRGSRIRFVNSQYSYFLLKPTELYRQMFNLDREILLVYSRYDSFQPRTLDAFDIVREGLERLRVDKICGVLVSNDESIERKIRDLLKSDEESQVLVPFSYSELLSIHDDYFVRNRFRAYFYTRDLFSFHGPLKRDIYFFGRTDLVHRIVSRHTENENTGLFGLRRSGKTSVIYGVERAIQTRDGVSVRIDCQDPAFHQRRWNEALWYILNQIVDSYDLQIRIGGEDKYTNKRASELFRVGITKIHNVLGKVLIIFDEVENITFNISPSTHWRTDLDFIYFWQALRASYQSLSNVFSYLIVGTNPMSAEMSSINGYDNPIFSGISPMYIESFDVSQTREMVRMLGSIMGLKFEERIYTYLTEDFGGHPYLMRMVCSMIHRQTRYEDRPITVNRALYNRAKTAFYSESVKYIELILHVLKEYYQDEYDLLEMLAMGDEDGFRSFAQDSPIYTNHLLGYGIIEESKGEYDFRIDIVKEHLRQKSERRSVHMTEDEMRGEIAVKRNRLEMSLRRIVQLLMVSKYGEADAKRRVLDVLGAPRKKKYASVTFPEIFDADRCDLYFNDLRQIILKEWLIFEGIFADRRQFDLNMQVINEFRVDAHPKSIDENKMDTVNGSLSQLLDITSRYLG